TPAWRPPPGGCSPTRPSATCWRSSPRTSTRSTRCAAGSIRTWGAARASPDGTRGRSGPRSGWPDRTSGSSGAWPCGSPRVPAGRTWPCGDRLRPVQPGRVDSQHLPFDRLRQRRIPVAVLELLGDVERPEGLDLVLRRAVEDAVGSPYHVVLADVLQQLSQDVRGGDRRAHHVPPRRTELGVDVLVRADARPPERGDQTVHPDVGGGRGVRALGQAGLEAGVVHDEVDLRVLPGRRTDVDG